MPDDHNPFNDPETRHPRARELMADEALWDRVSDAAPFGSDEGHTAYFEFRRWRKAHPGANLTSCLNWILEGNLHEFTEDLLDESSIAKLATGDDTDALLGLNYPDVFTLDTTIVSTALAQLADEGRIDSEAKPYVRIALKRQLHPAVLSQWRTYADKRRHLLEAAAKAIEAA